MIAEQYVTFETARLLKEAGFDEICDTFYSSNVGAPYLLCSRNSELRKEYYSRPTQALAARWLREVHHIFIMLSPVIKGWIYDLFDLKKHQYILCNEESFSEQYEEAFETALQETLRLIIKKQRR